jgi:hypothetical protein
MTSEHIDTNNYVYCADRLSSDLNTICLEANDKYIYSNGFGLKNTNNDPASQPFL